MSVTLQIQQPDRATYIGGSDAATILGVSPWQTRYQLWAKKSGLVQEVVDPAKEKIFARGKRLEPVILQMFEDESGLRVDHRNRRFQDSEYPFLAAEIDGETGNENIDAKSAQPFSRHLWGEPGSDDIPIYYAAQFMHGLMVTGRDICHVAAMIGLDDFRIFKIHRDDELIALIRERELEFWELVQNQTPPPIETAEDAMSVWPTSHLETAEVSEAVADMVQEIKMVKAQIKGLETREEELRDAILPAFQDAEAIARAGRILATWKSQNATRLDQKAITAAHPEIVEQLKVMSSTRVLRIK
ncbi:MAG: YqaJ viral recombinase family nuclease [Acidobacteriaceae bacterium]